MVDYSKWDKLEVSDDSDIEVHPNVDKASFIKWKQRDIHEKRAQREAEIKGLNIQREMYTQLNKRVDSLLDNLDDTSIADETARNEYLASHFDKTEKCTMDDSQSEDAPTYNEMVEDLFTQVESDLKKEGTDPKEALAVIKKVKEHRQKTDAVLKQIGPKLQELEKERHEHITSSDYHTGFDSSFVNKAKKDAKTEDTKGVKTKAKTTTTSTITLNKPTVAQPSKPLSELGEDELLPETEAYANMSSENLTRCAGFLKSHPYIICEQQKDALLMRAFEEQLSGSPEDAKRDIRHSLEIQYLDDLFKGAEINHSGQPKSQLIDLFVSKVVQPNSPAYNVFEEDYQKTWNHIQERCKVLAQEQAKEPAEAQGVEQIQLRAMDPNTELIVQIPDDPKKLVFYNQVPDTMKKALQTGSLDKINEVFATLSVDEAEKILDLFDACGVIQVQALLDNEEQFDRLKEKYANEDAEGAAQTGQAAKEPPANFSTEVNSSTIQDDVQNLEITHSTSDVVD